MTAPTAPSLVRQGIYTAAGAGLLAVAVGGVLLLLNPPPKAAKAGGCGCGCGGSKAAATTGRAQVYG